MEQNRVGKSKTQHVMTLFVAAALAVAPGCSSTPANSNCVDQNNDGYCDNGGGSSSSSSRYYGSGGSSISKGSTSTGSSSGISQGSTGRGGIGSSGGTSSS